MKPWFLAPFVWDKIFFYIKAPPLCLAHPQACSNPKPLPLGRGAGMDGFTAPLPTGVQCVLRVSSRPPDAVDAASAPVVVSVDGIVYQLRLLRAQLVTADGAQQRLLTDKRHLVDQLRAVLPLPYLGTAPTLPRGCPYPT